MSYNPQNERTVLIGIPYKEAAKVIASKQKRTLRGTLEYLIEKEAKKEKVNISN